jgi:hypothetical protein
VTFVFSTKLKEQTTMDKQQLTEQFEQAKQKGNDLMEQAKPKIAQAIDYAKKNPDTVLLGTIALLLTDIFD